MKRLNTVTFLALVLSMLLIRHGTPLSDDGEPITSDGGISSPDTKVLSLGEFIRSATRNDTVFEEILIDELTLKYRKDLELPARDIERGVAQRHNVARVTLLAEMMRDVGDPDGGLSGHDVVMFHGRNASVMSFVMSGSEGSVFISTKDLASTASALPSNRPVSENIGISSA